MNKNIKLFPILYILNNLWFWNGIWILYYLDRTNYQGIGIIESSMFAVGLLLEVPTGAFADLFGKRSSLVLGFLGYALGDLMMAFSTNFFGILLSVFILVVGAAFFSGSSEALLYDSLKSLKRESEYDKILSRSQTYALIGMGIASIVGGFVYNYNNSLPFFLTFVGGFVGFVLTFFLEEPPIDSEKVTFKKFIKQNFSGFKDLFANFEKTYLIFTILSVSGLVYILVHVFDYAVVVDINLSESLMGILYGVLPFVGALGTFIYPKVKKASKEKLLLKVFGILICLSLLATAFVFPPLVVLLLIFRNTFYNVIDVIASDLVTKISKDENRATSLSSYALLRNLPYVLVAIPLGRLVDKLGVDSVTVGISIIFILLYVLLTLLRPKDKINIINE